MSAWNNEPDFCLVVDYDLPEYDAAYVSKTRFFLIVALVISLLIHAMVLVLKPYFVSHSDSPPVSTLSVAIELLPAIQDLSQEPQKKSQENMPEPQEKKQETRSSELRPKAIAEINNTDTNTDAQVIDKPIEWLTTDDYQTITESKNKKMDTDDALAFNPALKESRNKTRRVSRSPEISSLENWQDRHGNQFYKSGDSCFMSLPQANNAGNRDGVNWYRVACGGKSGGDMLDNVNREMRERFKNP